MQCVVSKLSMHCETKRCRVWLVWFFILQKPRRAGNLMWFCVAESVPTLESKVESDWCGFVVQKPRTHSDMKQPRMIKDSKAKWQAQAHGVEFSDYQVEQTLFSLFSPESGKGEMGRLGSDKKEKIVLLSRLSLHLVLISWMCTFVLGIQMFCSEGTVTISKLFCCWEDKTGPLN